MSDGKKKVWSGIMLPGAVLGIVIFLTGGLYGYNQYLGTQIQDTEKKIMDVTEQIEEVKTDPKLQVFSLLEKNKKMISELSRNSEITKIIQSLDLIEEKYGLVFDNISYKNGFVHLNATTSSKRSSDPYIAVSKFIEEYRNDKEADFLLPFIPKFTLQSTTPVSSEMKMPLILELTDNILKRSFKKVIPKENGVSRAIKKTEQKKSSGDISE